MSEVDADVLIAGGGPVGLALAIELGQRGVRTIVVERRPEPQRVPKGQNLTQRTMEHMRAWGVEARLRAARTIPPSYGIGGLTAYGTLLSDYHYDWLQREIVRPFYDADNERLPQYATEEVLRARVAELASVDARYGWIVNAVEATDGGARASIGPRAGGEAASLAVRYVIGCDGSRSTVREDAGIGQTISDHDRLMVLLVFRSQELNHLLARYPGKSFYNVLHPSQKGYWLFFGRVGLEGDWFFHAPVPREARHGGFDFMALLHAAVGAEFDVTLDYTGFWELRFALADAYRAGPLFVAGDAAHSHPPYGGYGINTGFEDARNLGWKLAATLAGWGGPDLLDSYHPERHGVFASTRDDFIARAIAADGDFLAAFDPARDRAAFEAEWAARGSGARDEVIAFEPNYEGSPIVWGDPAAGCSALGHHDFRAQAGHHLAPQPLSDGRSAHAALGSGFTLLAFDAPEEAVMAFSVAAERRGLTLTIVRDAWAPPRDRYGHRLVLVRPDQVVAWAGDEPDHDTWTILGRAMGNERADSNIENCQTNVAGALGRW